MSSLRRLESVRKLEEIKKESTGPVSFCQKFIICCMSGGTYGCICLIILLALALFGLTIAKIAVGSMYLNDCPAEPFVPIYLIVSGVISLVFNCSCRPSKSDDGQYKLSCEGCRAIIGLIVSLFTFAWLITGTVFVIRTRQAVVNCADSMTPSVVSATSSLPDINSTTTLSPGSACPTCHDGLLTFAFALVLTEWSFVALLVVIGFCAGCLICLVGRN